MAGVVAGQEVAGVRVANGGNLLGCAVGDDAAAPFPALRAHVEDVVGVADDVEIVFDDDDGVAEVGEVVKDFEEFADVVEVETGGGLVEEVEGPAGLALGKLAGKFHALRFAARQRGSGLAEVDVAEAYVDQSLEFLVDGRDVFDDADGVGDWQVEQVGDGVAVEFDRERLLIVPATVTYFTEDVDVGKEVHLDAALALSLAGLAAASLDVEGEAAGFVAAFAGLGEHRE